MPLAPALALGIQCERGLRRLNEQRDLSLSPERVAVKRLRPLPSADVHIPAVSERPRVEIVKLKITAPSNAGLADVIPSSPNEVANHIRVIQDGHPTAKGLQRIRFRAIHDPLRQACVVRLVEALFLMITPQRIIVAG